MIHTTKAISIANGVVEINGIESGKSLVKQDEINNIAIHEIGHALGLEHEQHLPHSFDMLSTHYEYINLEHTDWYERSDYLNIYDAENEEYDMSSRMHYAKTMRLVTAERNTKVKQKGTLLKTMLFGKPAVLSLLLTWVVRAQNDTYYQGDFNDKGVVENNGTESGESLVKQDEINLEKINQEQEEMKGHGEEEERIDELQAAYDRWIEDCIADGAYPKITDQVKDFLEQFGLTEAEMKADCDTPSGEGRRKRSRVKRTLMAASANKWDKCIIPFVFDSSLPDTHKSTVLQAHDEYEKYTGFRFKPFTGNNAAYGITHNNYLNYIKDDDDCWSALGYVKKESGGQNISPCLGVGIAIHEIGHALGLQHEQQLPHSFDMLSTHFEFVNDDYKIWYKKYDYLEVYDAENEEYDMTSRMSYGKNTFNKNYGPTLSMNDPELTNAFDSDSTYYMFRDLMKYYNCFDQFPDTCGTIPTCQNDGYPTVLNGQCGCRCPPNLDPATNCATRLHYRDCEDIHNTVTCKNWADQGECEKNPVWMIPNCRNSCRKCGVGTDDCGEIKTLPTETTYEFTTPNYPDKYPKFIECLWLYKSPEGTTMKIEFPDFQVSTASDTTCSSYVDLKTITPAIQGFKFCGHGYLKWHQTVNNYLTLTLVSHSSEPWKGFKAKITILKETDKCYKGDGKDRSYAGTLDYTKNFQQCLQWKDVNCPFNQFDPAVQDVDLSHNYCRNVGTGRMPWCYTNAEQCLRANCDACMIGTCFDTRTDCETLIENDAQFCAKNEYDLAKSCMSSCGLCASHTPKTVAGSVTCPTPGQVDGISPVPASGTFNAGDVVSYKCATSDTIRTRTCTSEGTWTHLGYVCSGCPTGWTAVSERCHKWLGWKVHQTYTEAKASCAALNSDLAILDSQEAIDVVNTLTNYAKEELPHIWLGMNADSNHVFKWNDGTDVSAKNWARGEPNNWRNEEDCAFGSTKWHDISCDSSTRKHQVVCTYTPTGHCVDIHNTVTCKFWADRGECEKNPGWMIPNCRNSCRKCGETAPFVCKDDLPNCAEIMTGTPDMCQNKAGYAWANCRKSCAFGACVSAVTCSVTAPSDATRSVGSDSLTQGQYVEYKCNTGFLKSGGDEQRVCLPSGQFSGDALVCTAISSITNYEMLSDVELWRRGYQGDTNRRAAIAIQDPSKSNTAIKYAGKITAWTYYSNFDGEIAFQIWRPNTDVSKNQIYVFIGQNIVSSSAEKRVSTVQITDTSQQISAKPGDVIGLYMKSGVLTFSRCESRYIPERSYWYKTTSEYDSASNFTPNTEYTFSISGQDCRLYSLRVTMNLSG